MFKAVSKKLVDAAVQRDIVKPENTEDYTYGLNAFMTTLVNIVSALAIGLVMRMLFEIVLFIFVYKYLRKYTGGSHAKTAAGCYIASCITYIAALTVIKYYPFSSFVTAIIVVAAAVVLFAISPVEAEKKPLDEIERKVFRRRSRLNILIFVFLFLFLHYAVQIPYLYYCSVIIAVSVFTVMLFALIGKLHQVL